MGHRQAYEGANDSSPNDARLGQKCGKGVYLAPNIETCISFTSPVTFENKSYRIYFQCRINPSKVRIPISN